MLDPWNYREMLRAASLRIQHALGETLAGREFQDCPAEPYRLQAEQLAEIAQHVAGITRVLDGMRLEQVPALVIGRAEGVRQRRKRNQGSRALY